MFNFVCIYLVWYISVRLMVIIGLICPVKFQANLGSVIWYPITNIRRYRNLTDIPQLTWMTRIAWFIILKKKKHFSWFYFYHHVGEIFYMNPGYSNIVFMYVLLSNHLNQCVAKPKSPSCIPENALNLLYIDC